MYICICNGVTEKDIEKAMRDGACSLNCIKQQLGVSNCCGQCADRAADFIQENPKLKATGELQSAAA